MRERLAFLRQFDPKDIDYFVKDGLEHWSEPYATLSYTHLHAAYRQEAQEGKEKGGADRRMAGSIDRRAADGKDEAGGAQKVEP